VLSNTGRQTVIGVLGPGDFFGEHALTRHPVRLETATAVTATTVLMIPRQQMVRLLHEEPHVPGPVHRVHTGPEHSHRRRTSSISCYSMPARSGWRARWLLLAHYGKPEETHRVLPRISQETVTEMIGTRARA
jgi:CRP-like cAMP-binding protein